MAQSALRKRSAFDALRQNVIQAIHFASMMTFYDLNYTLCEGFKCCSFHRKLKTFEVVHQYERHFSWYLRWQVDANIALFFLFL